MAYPEFHLICSKSKNFDKEVDGKKVNAKEVNGKEVNNVNNAIVIEFSITRR